ncbi:MAG: lipid-A-disaccharide synthase [Gammaproteobacteria bacterium]|nr:lipid-A-disaccharide synthase [Gammaproteobacteria bacterium]
MVAGEVSGDRLGAGLIRALRRRYPDAQFEGIGGDAMAAEGFRSLYPLERLAVMGFVEPLKRLPELLRIRRGLARHFRKRQPALFVGIDAPDFNLGLELTLRGVGIRTAHYVSPSVWAWRQGRIRKIARAVDHMLVLFPFEAEFYRRHGVPVTWVGHPLADELPLEPDTAGARRRLALPADAPVLAVLPGSRGSEVALLGPLFLDTLAACRERVPGLLCVLPAANAARRAQIAALLAAYPGLPVQVLDGQSHTAMAAADAVLLASGTSALEAMLLKKPMVVAYRTGRLTHALASRLVKLKHVSLPNLLAGRELVPELLQDAATVEALSGQVSRCLDETSERAALIAEFDALHRQLRRGASERAAAALAELIDAAP